MAGGLHAGPRSGSWDKLTTKHAQHTGETSLYSTLQQLKRAMRQIHLEFWNGQLLCNANQHREPFALEIKHLLKVQYNLSSDDGIQFDFSTRVTTSWPVDESREWRGNSKIILPGSTHWLASCRAVEAGRGTGTAWVRPAVVLSLGHETGR
jgi:hypothetical protein